jgi:hypothetical protein
MNQQDCVERAGRTERSEPETDGLDILAGMTPAQREALVRLRRQVRSGERSDYYPVDKRQDFVRWLVQHGKLSDS